MVRYNTVLKLSDYSDADFAACMREVFKSHRMHYPTYPHQRESAKAWEVTQAVRALKDFGVLHPRSELLGVGAGFEHTVFYLTNFVKRVFATDLYAANESWLEADSTMLRDPAVFAPPETPWRPDRLVVQHMDARDLRYENNSFDGVFSCGSIEHFGTLENVAMAVREMSRVLIPGGILSLSTEFRLDGPDGLGIPGSILFKEDMIRKIIETSGLLAVDTPDFNTSEETICEAYPLMTAVENGIRDRSVALSHEGYTWTSIALCLQKPAK